jgi:hypothetical protein
MGGGSILPSPYTTPRVVFVTYRHFQSQIFCHVPMCDRNGIRLLAKPIDLRKKR